MVNIPRRCFLHIGLPKTGTTYLQSVLWQSRRELEEQGLAMLPESHPAAYRTMLAVQDRLDPDIDAKTSAELLADLAQRAAAASTDDVLLSQEQLAASTSQQIEQLARCFTDFEVHVVVTARSLARQIPSGWQERIKTRKTHSYDEFVRAVVAREPLSKSFWRHQGLLNVVKRWGASLGHDRMHIIPIPQDGSNPGVLLERYCGVLGVDPTLLNASVTRDNTSLGFVQAELLRRVNVALGERLGKPRAGYSRVAKSYLVAKILREQRSAPPLLPAETESWCRGVTEKWIAELDIGEYDIVGDLGDLRPLATSFAPSGVRADDAEVSTAAVAALATVLDSRLEEMRERDREQAELKRLRARIQELGG